MRKDIVALCIAALFLNACAAPIDIESAGTDNTKEFGTVIARAQAHDVNTHGMSNSVSDGVNSGSNGAGYTAATGAVSGAQSGSAAPVISAVGSTLTNVASAVTFGIFTTPVDRSGIDYTIKKTNGDIVHVIQFPNDVDDDPIFYPGQQVIIQTNGKYQKLVAPVQ